jgi:hypothetical protein
MSYSIICNVYGEKVDGVKFIRDKSLNAHAYAVFGYSCDAKAYEMSYAGGADGHLYFAWAWTGKIGFDASISVNPYGGFTITGGGPSGMGSESVYPYELN